MNSQLIFVVIFFQLIYFVIGEKVLICDGSQLSIKCKEGQAIVFEHARYGRSDTRTCASQVVGRTRDTNCALDTTLAILNENCFGKSSCDLAVGKRTFSDPCPGTSKYLSAFYQCVPASQIIEVCKTYYIKETSGYLISPHYPQPYEPKVKCVSELVPKPGYFIKTTLLDLEVEARATKGCYDWLILQEKDSPVKQIDYCGNMASNSEPTENTYEKLVVKFQPDPMNNYRGFLIKFEAVSKDGEAIEEDLPDPVDNDDDQNDNVGQAMDSGELKILELKKTLLALEQQHKEQNVKKQKEKEEEERRRKEEELRQKEEEEDRWREEEAERQRKEIEALEQARKMKEEEQRKAQEKRDLEKEGLEGRILKAKREAEIVARERLKQKQPQKAVQNWDESPEAKQGGAQKAYKVVAPHEEAELPRAGGGGGYRRRNFDGVDQPRNAGGCSRGAVPVPVHGFISSIKEGKRAIIECVQGYNMDDEDSGLLVCHGDVWAGEPGTCIPVECGPPEVPAHGEVIYRQSVVGSDAEYLCHKKYNLVGTMNRKCLEDGHWSGSTPFCAPVGGKSLSLFGEVLVAMILTILFMYFRKRCRGCQLEMPIKFTPAKEAQL